MATTVQEFRQEEKIALANELGLTGIYKSYKQAQELTNLKFQPITPEEIRKRLFAHLWQHPKGRWIMVWQVLQGGLIGVGLGLVHGILVSLAVSVIHLLITGSETWLWQFLVPFPVVGGMVIGMISVSDPPNLTTGAKSATLWSHGFPYGALLAMKEAKDTGFYDFNVWSPQHQEHIDPIVTGLSPAGQLVCLFEWIDGEVYTK